jgi:replicative DNA helicase
MAIKARNEATAHYHPNSERHVNRMAYNFDINMLRMMQQKRNYSKYIHLINGNVVTEGTLGILKDFGKYFDKFAEHQVIDYQLFVPRMHNWNTDTDEQVMATRMAAVRAAMKGGNVSTEVEHALQDEIANALLDSSIATLRDRYAEGEIANLGYEISVLMDAHKKNAGTVKEDFIDDCISTLLDEDDDQGGYVWRLHCMRMAMRGLRAGDFGIAAGRPDKGKTTWIASESTFLAPQIPKHRNVLWLNNEGPGRRIIPRIYQAALGITRSEMVKMSGDKTLIPAYEELMGRTDKIRVVDIHGMHISKIEGFIEKHDAEIVIYDMIDNMKGFENAGRTDERLEQLYQWGRECAVKHGHAGIASSQISVEGDGEQFPGLSMLKDSKTGKQGACDWQLMIGASNDPMMGQFRYMGLPKNKLRREGQASDPRATVNFEPEIARYTDAEIMDE